MWFTRNRVCFHEEGCSIFKVVALIKKLYNRLGHALEVDSCFNNLPPAKSNKTTSIRAGKEVWWCPREN